MTLKEILEIPEPNGNRPIRPNELLAAGGDFADFYSGDESLTLSTGLAELIIRKFPQDADEVLTEVLAVARRQSGGEEFHPIAKGQKQLIITEDVHGNGGSIYLAVKPLP